MLSAAIALAVALRFSALDARGWWRDEAVTVELLRLPFTTLLRTIPESEGTPPLYYVLAWGWTRIFGDGETGLRSLSALLGTLVVVVLYLAGRTLVGHRGGLCAAFLAAASPLLVWHAQDGRSYSLLVLLGALSFLFFVRLLRAPSLRDAAAWAGVASLALLTHYFAAFVLVAQFGWLAAAPATRRLVLLAAALPATVGLALVPLALAQSGNVSWIAEVPRTRRIAEVAEEFLVGPQAPRPRVAAAAAGVLVLAGVAAVLVRASRRERLDVLSAAAVGAAGLAIPLVLALGGLDYVLARNLVAAWPPLALVPAAGLALLRPRVLGGALASALVVLGVAVVVASAGEPKFRAEDWRGAARALGAPPAAGRAIVLWPGVGADPFLLYRPRARHLPPEGAEVGQVVVVALGPRHSVVERYRASLFPPEPFRQTRRQEKPWFTLVQFDAPGATFVKLERLVATGPGAPHTFVMLEREP